MGAMHVVRSVMIVDDDQRILAAGRRLLYDRTVFTAGDTSEARQIAVRERPDVAIVDLRLADGSGLELIGQLKHLHPEITNVLVSGWLSVPFAVEAMRVGAKLVVSKPFSPRDVVSQIEHGPAKPPDLTETPTLAQMEYEYIARVMADCSGNVSQAARRLGIFRQSLQRKLRKQPPA